MGAVAIFSMGLMLLMLVPITTALFAKRMGRRPWLWLLIGLVLPGIASFILFFLPDLSEQIQ